MELVDTTHNCDKHLIHTSYECNRVTDISRFYPHVLYTIISAENRKLKTNKTKLLRTHKQTSSADRWRHCMSVGRGLADGHCAVRESGYRTRSIVKVRRMCGHCRCVCGCGCGPVNTAVTSPGH